MAIKPKYIVNKSITASKEFTDRDKYLAAFNRALSRENLDDNKILVYYGVGGIGKSSLINKICMNIDSDVEYAILDVNEGNNKTIENGLYSLRKSFSKGRKFPLFDLAYAVYWKKCHPNSVMNENNFPFLEEGSIALNIISALGDFPVVSILSAVMSASDKISKNIKNYYLSMKNEVNYIEKMSISELEERLPYYWASDFSNSISNINNKKVIFIDTYEAIWENDRTEGLYLKKDEWIRNLATALPNVLFVICGREKLRWRDENPEWDDYIEQHLIGALSDIDAKKFLITSNITDEIIQDAIIDGSDGVPYYLDLAVDTYYSIKREGKECLPEYFEGTPKEIFYRFIKHLTKAEIETLKVLAVPRYFDFKLFSALVKEFNTGYAITSFYEFCSFSFITERECGEVYEMQKLMKESLITYQNDSLTANINKFMTNYYNDRLDSLILKGNIEVINDLIYEFCYHGREAYSLNEFLDKFLFKTQSLIKLGQYTLIIDLLENMLYMDNYNSISISNLLKFSEILIQCYTLLGKNQEAEIYIDNLVNYLDENSYGRFEKLRLLRSKVNIYKELYGVEKSINFGEKLYCLLKESKEKYKINDDYNDILVSLLIELGKLNVFVKDINKAKNCYDEANEICNKDLIIKRYECLGLINERLGEIYSEHLNDYDTANNYYILSINSYNEALKSDNKNSIINLNMGLAYKRIGENYLSCGNIDKSIENCLKAIEIYDLVINDSPDIVDSYIKKGFAYTDWLKRLVKNSEYKELCKEFFLNGTEAFEKALEFTPYNRSILTGLNGAYRAFGMLSFDDGKTKEAIEYLTKAINYGTRSLEIIKDHPYSYNSRAKSYQALGIVYSSIDNIDKVKELCNKAIEDYKSILKITPKAEYCVKRIDELSKGKLNKDVII